MGAGGQVEAEGGSAGGGDGAVEGGGAGVGGGEAHGGSAEGGSSGKGGGGSSGYGGLPNAGTGGSGLPICDQPAAENKVLGCLVDAAGTKSGTLAKTAVEVVEVVEVGTIDATACLGTGPATRIRLRAAGPKEWSYFVSLPGRPRDQLQAGDELDLSAAGQPNWGFFDQTVVLGRGRDLVLFTTVTWSSAEPDLSAYDTTVQLGPAYCVSSSPCGIMDSYPLLITRKTESAEVRRGGPTEVGNLFVTVAELSKYRPNSSIMCDPGSWYRYGGFLPR